MVLNSSLATAYVVGGITFVPLLLFTGLVLIKLVSVLTWATARPAAASEVDSGEEPFSGPFYKVGWLKVSRGEQPPLSDTSIGDLVKSYISGKAAARRHSASNVYFAVLKYNTLYLYDSEKQLDCKEVVRVGHYTVHIDPPHLQDFELFSRPQCIKLKRSVALEEGSSASASASASLHTNSNYYINCTRCIDKEDWYFALHKASRLQMPAEGHQPNTGETALGHSPLNQLILTVHSDEHHFQTQWLNAILGRLFFAVYKTQAIKAMLLRKAVAKVDKLNAQRPPFLGEITVRSVDPGHSLPSLTQPRLLGLSPTGELTAEAMLQYDGGFRIEIETVVRWKYSDHLRPLTVAIVLAITLKELQGKLFIKIKEPPTNRLWYGFYEPPKMEWLVEPVVWDKHVGYSVIVKAIETKIQELIIENMVLPNMDDIVFFSTDGMGGIFCGNDMAAEGNAVGTEAAPDKKVDTRKEEAKKEEVKKDTSKTDPQRKKIDEALLSTAKSLPELFSASPEKIQSLHPSSPHLLPPTTTDKIKKKRWFAKDSSRHPIPSFSDSVTLFPESQMAYSPKQRSLMNIAGTLLNRKQAVSDPPYPFITCTSPTTSPTSSPTISPCTVSLKDDVYDTLSLSSSYGTYASHSSMNETDIDTDFLLEQQKGMRLRKSGSMARLRAKSVASTAVSQVNVAPSLVHQLRSVRSTSHQLKQEKPEKVQNLVS
ncbi:putative integral membrane protein conserved region-domain-containing protein [Spinellus fusiger]|nr:putative integral membrane protein conserved region-domain-containing protein [Spinellus fusiger]